MALPVPMKLSTRNQIKGTVSKVKKGPVDATITLDIAEGNQITAVIPEDAVDRLGLAAGIPAYAIVSSFVVMLSAYPAELNLSSQTKIKGAIVSIKEREDALTANLSLDIGGDNILNATISADEIERLSLAVGGTAYAIISAYAVMLGVDPTEMPMDFGH